MGFSMKDFSTDLMQSAKTGAANGTLDVGNLANSALDAAASAVPFGSTIKDILDKLGLQENLGLLKYGLSSWGASNSPEKSKKEFAEKALPTVMAMVEEIKLNPATLAQGLTSLHSLITLNMAHHIHRVGKSRAKSSKLGHQASHDSYKKLLDGLVTGFVSQFKKMGVVISKRPWDVSLQDLPINSYLMHDGRPIDSTYGAQFYQFEVDYSNAKVETNDQGKLVAKSSGGGGMASMVALAGFAIFKFMK